MYANHIFDILLLLVINANNMPNKYQIYICWSQNVISFILLLDVGDVSWIKLECDFICGL